MTRSALCATCIVALLLWPFAVAMAQPLSGGAQDPLTGSRIFGEKGCVKCHSVNGVGGKVGPDLGRIQRPRSFYDLATAMWNHLPRMAARMRSLGIARPRLDSDEAANLIGFLYTLNYFDRPPNVEAGRRLFREKRCVLCHQVGGVGGVVGPNLDFLRQFGSPISVAAAMWNHGPQMVETMKARGVARPSFTGSELRDLLGFLTHASGGQTGPVYVLPGRADVGRTLFAQKQCIQCHSIAGQGGHVGPDLAARGAHKTPIEFAAAMWNKAPKMLAAMKTHGITLPLLHPAEMADIVAYLQSVGYFAESGSVQRGWKVAHDKGCLTCHAVYGERGKTASDLSKAQGLESPAAVIAALWNHALVTAPAPSGGKSPWPQFRPSEMTDLVALLRSLGRKH